MKSLRLAGGLFGSLLLFSSALRAWDYAGHRIVNELALRSLPADFPAFVHEPANAERIAFLAGEPDRWRNVSDLPLRQYNGMDHYLDLEQLPAAGLDLGAIPSLRYDFAVAFARGRAAHPGNFPPIDPEEDADHSREWPGFAPWAVTEYYGKLRSAFSYLKTFEELGTPEETVNAKENIIYLMGMMGHYVGDIAQPLHATVHHHGWEGDNPHGYTTWPGIHAWIDGGFIAKAGVTTGEIAPRLAPAEPIALASRADGRDPVFVAVFEFLEAQNRQVEPLYQLEKEGKLGHDNQPITPEARAFIDGQLLKGGEMLGAVWLTAWRSTTPDEYLRKQLLKRQAAKSAAK
ncbi:MAG TPA: hypothetical protein VG710_16470 [Opitutus sp.]|nr:hypothetical protein [Opitutus sp.]